MKEKLIKLRNMLLNFKEVHAEEGVTLTVDGDVEVGKNAYVTDDEGDVVPAPDGEYTYDLKKVVVKEGVIIAITDAKENVEVNEEPETETEPEPEVETEEVTEEVTEDVTEEVTETEPEPEPEPEPEAEPKPDAKDVRIAELEAENNTLKALIAELEAKLDEPAADSVEKQYKEQEKFEAELTPEEKAANIVKYLKTKK